MELKKVKIKKQSAMGEKTPGTEKQKRREKAVKQSGCQ